MSNLQTLLDAAKFVECTNTPDSGARAPDPPEFHHYAKTAPSRKRSNSGSDRSDHNEDGKDQKRYGGFGTREVHNILEKNRRAHLKESFDGLKNQIPHLENHNKVSKLSILRGAYRYIQSLKKAEKELEEELKQLTMKRSQAQERINSLQRDLRDMNISVDIANFMTHLDEDTRSVSTATAHNSNPILSDDEELIPDTPNKADKKCSTKPPLSFCNVIVMSSAPLGLDSGIQAVPEPKPVITSPVYIKSLPNNNNQSQSNTAGNNRTIAAMLSAPAHTAVLNGITTKENMIAVAGVPTTTAMATVVRPMSLVTNAYSVAAPTNGLTNTKTVVEPSVTPASQIHGKNSITQLLQQTVAQRIQLQQVGKLQQQQQQQQQQPQPQQHVKQPTIIVATTIGTNPANINVSQLSGTVPQVITVNANTLQPVGASLKNVAQMQQAMALNHVLPSQFTPLVTSAAVASTAVTTMINSEPITIATLNKSQAQSQNAANAVTMANQLNLSSSPNVSLATISGLQTLNIKPILTLPITQLPGTPLASQQVTTLQQLMSQTMPKTNTFQRVAGVVSTSSTTPTVAISAGGSQMSAVTPTAIAPIPVTQFLPISIVTPASGHVNLTNAALSSHVIKSLGQIPLLQQQISLPIKPLVMVTLANTVTSTGTLATPTTPTIQVNVPVTNS